VRAPRSTRRCVALGVALGAALGAASAAGDAGADGASEPLAPAPATATAPATPTAPATAPATTAAPAPPARYTPYVDRGQSLPAPYAYAAPGLTATLRTGKPTLLEASLAGGVGLTSHLWVDGTLGTLALTPRLSFHSVQIGPNALLVDTPAFELDVTTHVTIGAEDGRPIEQIEPGVFSVIHAGHTLRFDAGLFVDANPGPTTTFGVRVPVSVAFQLTDHVYGIVNSGVTVGDFADTAKTTAIPAGLTLGWGDRVGRGAHPLGFGVLPSISFPELIKPGAAELFRPGYVAFGITLFVVSKL
jgi:hypothetical protein